MSTQCITLDSVPWISHPEAAAAERDYAGENLATSLLADTDFFKGKSIEELAREQGVGPIKDIRVFAGGIPDDEDVDELLAQLEELRGA